MSLSFEVDFPLPTLQKVTANPSLVLHLENGDVRHLETAVLELHISVPLECCFVFADRQGIFATATPHAPLESADLRRVSAIFWNRPVHRMTELEAVRVERLPWRPASSRSGVPVEMAEAGVARYRHFVTKHAQTPGRLTQILRGDFDHWMATDSLGTRWWVPPGVRLLSSAPRRPVLHYTPLPSLALARLVRDPRLAPSAKGVGIALAHLDRGETSSLADRVRATFGRELSETELSELKRAGRHCAQCFRVLHSRLCRVLSTHFCGELCLRLYMFAAECPRCGSTVEARPVEGKRSGRCADCDTPTEAIRSLDFVEAARRQLHEGNRPASFPVEAWM